MSVDLLDRERRPMVPWDTIGQPAFDRLLEALLHRRHTHPDDEIRAHDGRGGDRGVDVFVRTHDSRNLIYQFKYFPEGFDGRFKNRRTQISSTGTRKGSLETALANHPDLDEWILVAPCNPTRSGWVYLDDLRKRYCDVTITFVGRDALDANWVAPYPDVVRALLSRDEALEKAAVFGTEKALLAGGVSDLLDRHAALDQISRDADPDWWWQVSTQGDVQVAALQAHHPRAPEVSPISINFAVDRSSADPSLESFRRALRFGALEPARLPGELVSNFVVHGPAIVRESRRRGEISEVIFESVPAADLPQPVSLELTDSDSRSTVHRGKATKVAHGEEGWTMRQEFANGAIALTWRLPMAKSGPAEVDLSTRMARADSSHLTEQATSLLLTWSRCREVRMVTSDGTTFARLGELNGSLPDELVENATILHEFAQDLGYIERETGREFSIPDELSVMQRIDTRIFRMLLEGRVTCLPHPQNFTATLAPEALSSGDLTADLQLAFVYPREGAAEDGVSWPEWTLEAVADQGKIAVIELQEQLGHYFPAVYVEDAPRVVSELSQGNNVKVRCRPRDGRPPRVFLPGRLAEKGDVGATLHEPEPWALHGVSEVAELQVGDNQVARESD